MYKKNLDNYIQSLSDSTLQRAMDYVNQLLIIMDNHYYHHYFHALEVMERAIYLAQKEGLQEDEIEIIALAGLFHDTGFTIQYDDNEYIGAKIARNYLKSNMYSEEKIARIEEMIMATRLEYTNPKNIYEKIIKDADLDNLGRDDFTDKGNQLKKELEAIKKIKIKDPDWKHGSIMLLQAHKYYTKTQQEERNQKKAENLKKLKNT